MKSSDIFLPFEVVFNPRWWHHAAGISFTRDFYLSPIRMLQCTPAEMAADAEMLLRAAGPLDKTGLCCINMDYGTPDDNLFAVYEVVQRYRQYGA